MEKSKTIKSVSYIIAGALLQIFYGIGGGISSSIIAIFGLVIFFLGLKQLKDGLDEKGAGAVSLLIIAALIGIAASVIGLIPIIGLVAIILFIVAFIVQLIGYLKLKSSETIGTEGKKGAGMLVISMILSLLASIFGLIPLAGAIISTLLAIAALYFMFSGWVNVQLGLLKEEIKSVTATTQILIGTLLMLCNSASSGWGAAIVSILGLVLLIRGFNTLKSNLDEAGAKAVGMLILAVYVGILASVLDFVDSIINVSQILTQQTSTLGMIVIIAFAASYVMQFLGYMQLKNSSSIGDEGKKGITYLMISMIAGILVSLAGFIVIPGLIISFTAILVSLLAIVAIILVFFGWVKVQGGLLENK